MTWTASRRFIPSKGIYRDPVRSSHSHFVKASGLRWLSVMLLAPIPWAGRVWARPVLTALGPSERYCREHGHRHKKLTDYARQLLLQVRRWLSERALVAVADSSFAALAAAMTCVTRRRLDARHFTPAPPRAPGTVGRPRVKGERLPLLSTLLTDAGTRWERVTVAGWYAPVRRGGTGRRADERHRGVAPPGAPGRPPAPGARARRARRRARPLVAVTALPHVRPRGGRDRTPAALRAAPNRGRLLRRVNGQSRA